MELDLLQPAVVAYFRRQAEALGMDPTRLDATYRLNWGGFVNQSFRLSDGRTAYHLKLAGTADARRGLGRWYRTHPLLTERYHAPAVVAWVIVPGTEHAGLLLEDIAGESPDGWPEPVRSEIAATIARLHRDSDLRSYLATGELAGSCEAGFRETFLVRFREDLTTVRQAPPFISGADLGWMDAEADRLEEAVVEAPAFGVPADRPIHGDLGTGNVLLRPGGGWALLDWDDLRLGDPVLDYALLHGPTPTTMTPATWGNGPDWFADDRLAAERLPLYARATMLDWVIDSLADYVEADAAPEHAGRVRAEKERLHRMAKREYLRQYDA